jgi:hypothetical protein
MFRQALPDLRVLQAYNLFDHATATLVENTSMSKLTHLLFHSHADDPCIDQRGPYLTLDDLRRVLAARHLQSLTHLQFRLSDIGDQGCALIARSGILKRLKVLDLRHGRITDRGVGHLLACPDMKNLARLDLSRNTISAQGVARLQSSGLLVVAGDQHSPDDRFWLYEGDFE